MGPIASESHGLDPSMEVPDLESLKDLYSYSSAIVADRGIACPCCQNRRRHGRQVPARHQRLAQVCLLCDESLQQSSDWFLVRVHNLSDCGIGLLVTADSWLLSRLSLGSLLEVRYRMESNADGMRHRYAEVMHLSRLDTSAGPGRWVLLGLSFMYQY